MRTDLEHPNCAVAASLRDAAVIGALDSDERALYDAHVRHCALCRTAEVDAAEAVAALALAAPAREPSPLLRARIRAAARAERGLTAGPSFRPVRWWWRREIVAVAAAALIAVVGTGFGISGQLDAAVERQRADRYASYLRSHENAWALLERQPMTGRELRAEGNIGATGRLYASPESEVAVLVVNRLPPLPEDRVYQVWLIQDGQRASGGTFRVDRDGFGWLTIKAPTRIGEFQSVGVTPEPRGGSPGPTGTRILGGNL